MTLRVSARTRFVCVSRDKISTTTLILVRPIFLSREYYSKKKSNFVDLVYESGQNKRALGPATNLLRLGNYRIDYSQVDPQLRKLLVAEKKQNTNSFYNLLRLYDMIIFNN